MKRDDRVDFILNEKKECRETKASSFHLIKLSTPSLLLFPFALLLYNGSKRKHERSKGKETKKLSCSSKSQVKIKVYRSFSFIQLNHASFPTSLCI